MQVHFIGMGEVNMFNLAVALHKNGTVVTGSDEVFDESLKTMMEEQGLLSKGDGWFSDSIHTNLDAVVIGSKVQVDNPELVKAQELGLPLFSFPDFLYEQAKYKTRVVIAGSQHHGTVTQIILHALEYNDVAVDYVTETSNGIHLSKENDFILIEASNQASSFLDATPQFQKYIPNIALLSDIAISEAVDSEQFAHFVDSVVKGGSITYNDEDLMVKELVEASENPIRKFPYATPAYQEEDGEIFLETPDGELPLEISGPDNLRSMAGAKWICQQMGVDEVEFYEAMSTFH